MTALTFTYTSAKKATSTRTIYLISKPNPLYQGIDISELDSDTRTAFLREMDNAKAIYDEMVKQINAEFDTQFRFRAFTPEGMANIVVE